MGKILWELGRVFGAILHMLWQDLRYAARVLRHNPGFSAIAILTLALGIGANTTIFSVINTVLLVPLPFPQADRLVVLHESSKEFHYSSISYPNFLDWQRMNRSFSSMAAYLEDAYDLSGNSHNPMPVYVMGEDVSANVSGLALAGIGALLGLAGAIAGGRLLASDLYGVHPGDAATLAAAVALLLAIASLASFIPASRAARVDPTIALRQE